MPEIRVNPTNTEHRRIAKTEWRSLHSKADALGNTIHFRIDLNGPEPFGYAWRENAQGVRFGDSLRIVIPDTRPDDGTMWIAGTSAWFKMSTHDSEQEGVRDHDEWRYEWVNVYAPWPGQPQGAGEPEGAAHAMAPEVGGGGGGEVDYDRVKREVSDEVITKFMRQGGPAGTIVDNIQPKQMSALGDLYDPEARNHEKPAYRALVVRAQDKAFKRNDDDFYLIINKLITGQDPNHPIENEGFRNLIKELMNEVLDEREGAQP